MRTSLFQHLPGRHLFVIVPHMKSVTADALAQAYESDVMVPLKAFTTRNLPAKRHRICHGTTWFFVVRRWWSVHSSGDRLAPRTCSKTSGTPQSRSFQNTGSTTQSGQGWHEAAQLSCRKNHNDDILAATKSLLQQQDYSPNLSVHPNSPFQLGLLRNLLQLMQVPDIGLIDSSRVRIPHGCSNQYGSGIWRRQPTEAREDLLLTIHDTNWKSAEEDPNTVSRLIQEDIDAKFVQEFHGEHRTSQRP